MSPVTIDPNCRGRFEIMRSDGRVIWMTHLTQWLTYSGLLEGHPEAYLNQLTVGLAKSQVESHFGNEVPVIVISPEASQFNFPVVGVDESVTCEVLPAITFGARFDSESVCAEANTYSSAIIM